MKNTIRSLILIATSLAAGAAIALGVDRLVGKAGEERAKGDSLAVAPAAAPCDTVREIRSLDELFAIDPRDTVIGSCNLSHLGLKVLPDLSKYTIRRLDLSHNEIDRMENPKLFPKGLVDLSVSHNKLYGIYFPNSLKRLDISYNRIESGGLWLKGDETPEYVGFGPENYREKTTLRYLDISYNWYMYYKMPFDVYSVDTLIRVRAARGYELERMWPAPLRSGQAYLPPAISRQDTIIR